VIVNMQFLALASINVLASAKSAVVVVISPHAPRGL